MKIVGLLFLVSILMCVMLHNNKQQAEAKYLSTRFQRFRSPQYIQHAFVWNSQAYGAFDVRASSNLGSPSVAKIINGTVYQPDAIKLSISCSTLPCYTRTENIFVEGDNAYVYASADNKTITARKLFKIDLQQWKVVDSLSFPTYWDVKQFIPYSATTAYIVSKELVSTGIKTLTLSPTLAVSDYLVTFQTEVGLYGFYSSSLNSLFLTNSTNILKFSIPKFELVVTYPLNSDYVEYTAATKQLAAIFTTASTNVTTLQLYSLDESGFHSLYSSSYQDSWTDGISTTGRYVFSPLRLVPTWGHSWTDLKQINSIDGTILDAAVVPDPYICVLEGTRPYAADEKGGVVVLPVLNQHDFSQSGLFVATFA